MNVQAPAKRYHHYDRYDPNAVTREVALTDLRLDRLYEHFVHWSLSTEMAHALVEPQKTQKITTTELKYLARKPNSYLERPAGQQDALDARWKPLIHKITSDGIAELVEASG